ncbi:PPE family protein [Mycobacterium sp. HUMS_1102779]|uniref:PPE family protein n=1 Tax=Mycobacterium sp. HUMS_1102779 TaxID=3383487 RepID=UPI003899E1BE
MSLEFPWLPPEINSALMFSGAGSGPLFTAAAAWGGLASELSGAASSFQSVVSGLTGGGWLGPASVSMAAAAAPYVGWLSAAAGQAEAAAAQAAASATAYEAARSATVAPAAVTANRAQLMALVATNFLGQNTPAIFETEFQYVEMWAQDVAAMFGYHGAATVAAASLPAFGLPPLSLAGLGGLLSAPIAALASSVGAALLAPVEVAMAPAVTSVTAVVSQLPLQSIMQMAPMLMYPASMMMSPLMMALQSGMHPAAGLASATGPLAGSPKFVGDVTPKGLGGGAGVGGLGAASAGLGKARLVGAMSVPPTWQGSSPARMVSAAMSGLGAEVPPGAVGGPTGGGGMPFMPMPMGGMGAAGGMPGGMFGRGGASPNAPQSRPSVIPRVGIG